MQKPFMNNWALDVNDFYDRGHTDFHWTIRSNECSDVTIRGGPSTAEPNMWILSGSGVPASAHKTCQPPRSTCAVTLLAL